MFTLQENSGILTDIPTENEILGIYRGNSEETQNWVSSEVLRNIPTEFRGNINPSEYSEEKCVLRKKPMNSEEIL